MTTPETTHTEERQVLSDRSWLGFSPTELVVIAGVSCLVAAAWGLYTRNFALVTIEVPSGLGLIAIATFGPRIAASATWLRAAAGVGLLCFAEVAIAVLVFDLHGVALFATVAISTLIPLLAGLGLWGWRRRSAQPQRAVSVTPDGRRN